MKTNDIFNIIQTIERIFYDLVLIRSDTGTLLERDIEKYLYEVVSNMEYFRKKPELCGLYNLESDHLGRSVVWGLVKGKGNKTIILMHHHDVVDAFDYGILLEYAYNPLKLHSVLRDKDIHDEVNEDLNSGEWIFGRGTADMKAGAAIQVALLEKYAYEKDFEGNILLLSVPDEESFSIGMREAVNLLVELKEKFDLEYKILINSEPHERKEKNTGLLYEGSVGKLMPVIYVRGKKSHVRDAFDGLNPITLLSEIAKRIDLNPDFQDVVGDEISPPPSFVYFRDRKECYDASIPQSAAGYFNILCLNTSPKDILSMLKEICEESFDSALYRINDNYKRSMAKIKGNITNLPWKSNVKLFTEIYEEAVGESGDSFIKDYNSTIERVMKDYQLGKINMQEGTILLIEKTLEYIKDLSPMVIIAFSPPYYPYVTNRDIKDLPNKVSKLSEELNKYSTQNWNERYEKRNYFMGISDMSYTVLIDSEEVTPYIAPNMPLWGNVYSIPFESMKKLSIPVINIGPWGKDLHKFTERVYKKDLFERTPKLIKHAIDYLLREKC